MIYYFCQSRDINLDYYIGSLITFHYTEIMQITRFKKFLTQLEKNNNKPWFDEHRDEYQDIRKQLVDFVTEVHKDIITFAPQFLDLNPSKALFRINRDVRFSSNKHLYKTGMGFKLVLGARTSNCPGYGFWISSEGVYIGGGTPKMPTKDLNHFRDYFVAKPAETKDLLQQIVIDEFEISQEYRLKTSPRGYDADHPLIELLKLQGYRAGKFFPHDPKTMTNDWLLETTIKNYEKLHPFVKFLQEARIFNPST